jgi:hypothetical protein
MTHLNKSDEPLIQNALLDIFGARNHTSPAQSPRQFGLDFNERKLILINKENKLSFHATMASMTKSLTNGSNSLLETNSNSVTK